MELQKIAGIYQIKNKINNKVYVGSSINITFRWYSHLSNLISNAHRNSKLQEDFNIYGVESFDFSILEICKDESSLKLREQSYLNEINFDCNYNIYNSVYSQIQSNYEEFVNYINSKWLLDEDCTNVKEYYIYSDNDKNEIIKQAQMHKIIPNLHKSKYTFNMIIGFLTQAGYDIKSDRFLSKKKKYTYKLIVGLDKEKLYDFIEQNTTMDN